MTSNLNINLLVLGQTSVGKTVYNTTLIKILKDYYLHEYKIDFKSDSSRVHWLHTIEKLIDSFEKTRNFGNVTEATSSNVKRFDFTLNYEGVNVVIDNIDFMGESISSFSIEVIEQIKNSSSILLLIDSTNSFYGDFMLRPTIEEILGKIYSLKKYTSNFRLGIVFTKVDKIPYNELPISYFEKVNRNILELFPGFDNKVEIFYISCLQFWHKYFEFGKENLKDFIKINSISGYFPYAVQIPFLWLLNKAHELYKNEQIIIEENYKQQQVELELQRLKQIEIDNEQERKRIEELKKKNQEEVTKKLLSSIFSYLYRLPALIIILLNLFLQYSNKNYIELIFGTAVLLFIAAILDFF